MSQTSAQGKCGPPSLIGQFAQVANCLNLALRARCDYWPIIRAKSFEAASPFKRAPTARVIVHSRAHKAPCNGTVRPKCCKAGILETSGNGGSLAMTEENLY